MILLGFATGTEKLQAIDAAPAQLSLAIARAAAGDFLEVRDQHVSRRKRIPIRRQLVERGGDVTHLVAVDQTELVVPKSTDTHRPASILSESLHCCLPPVAH